MPNYVLRNGQSSRRSSMPRYDLICSECEKIVKDVILKYEDIKLNECSRCQKASFSVYWGSGKAPSITVKITDSEELFKKSRTLGEFWDRKGVDMNSKANKKASIERAKRLKKKK